MSKRYGFDSFGGVGKNTNGWGGAAVARSEFFEVQGESGGFDPGRQPVPSFRSRSHTDHFDVAKKATKTLTIPLTYESLLEILRNGLWGYAYQNIAVGVEEHTFTIGTTKPSPLTGEVASSEANAFIYPSFFVRRITLNFRAGEPASMEVEIIADDETEDTKSGAPSFPDLDTLLVKPAQVAAEFDDVATTLDEATVVIEPGIDEGRPKLGSASIAEPEPTGKSNVTASLGRDWNSHTAYDKFISGATGKIEVLCTGGIISGADTYQFNVVLPQVAMTGESPVHGGPGLVSERIQATAEDDGTSTTACEITVQNSQAQLS